MKKLVILAILLFGASGLYWYAMKQKAVQSQPVPTDDYFDQGYVPGVFKAYDGSKEKINSVVGQENKKIQDALDQAGL